jgi:hypothetical protein
MPATPSLGRLAGVETRFEEPVVAAGLFERPGLAVRTVIIALITGIGVAAVGGGAVPAVVAFLAAAAIVNRVGAFRVRRRIAACAGGAVPIVNHCVLAISADRIVLIAACLRGLRGRVELGDQLGAWYRDQARVTVRTGMLSRRVTIDVGDAPVAVLESMRGYRGRANETVLRLLAATPA